MDKLIFSLGIIITGLCIGYIVQRMEKSGRLSLPIPLIMLRKGLQYIGIIFFMSISFVGALWKAEINDIRIIAMPFIGAAILLAGGFIALIAARCMKLTRAQTGAFYVCGSFTNIGSIGSLITFTLLGEIGFALVPLYKLLEEVIYFTIGFPIARYFSPKEELITCPGARLKNIIRDPFVLAALSAIMIGGGLNIIGIPRPIIFGTINSIFIPAGTFILMISIGLAMRFSSTRTYIRQCLTLIGIKFFALPALAVLSAHIFGLGTVMDGLPLKVILILSSMPVAFTALIPPSIYDLDIDLANACWFITTTALVVVVPVLYIILN